MLCTQMIKSRTFDLRAMSFSQKLFGKLQRKRTLPKDFDERSGLLLWLSRVKFVFLTETSGILHVVKIKYTSRILITSYVSFTKQYRKIVMLAFVSTTSEAIRVGC